MATVPGVTSAALTRTRLLSGTTNIYSAWKQGQTSPSPAEENMYMMDVSPAFFATMGIPVLRGRSFTDWDGPTGPKVAILNEAAARRLFPDGDVLGRRIGESFEKSGEIEVVGVVRDTKYASVRDPVSPTMYRCVWQTTQRNLHVVLRTAGEPLAMTETPRCARSTQRCRFRSSRPRANRSRSGSRRSGCSPAPTPRSARLPCCSRASACSV
jgi:putative ABC transport system permease protein